MTTTTLTTGYVSFNSATYISAANTSAVYAAASSRPTLANAGTLIATGTSVSAAQFLGGGIVINSGSIAATDSNSNGVILGGDGSVGNYGTISGGYCAVLFDGTSAGTISNAFGAMISAADNGVQFATGGGTVADAGTITGTRNGIVLFAGSQGRTATVSVASTGMVAGRNAIIAVTDPTILTNFGTIVGFGASVTGFIDSRGVDLLAGGTITNATAAFITGGGAGVYIAGPGTLINSGTVSALGTNAYGADLRGGGYISIASSGTIYGGSDGIFITGGGAVTNAVTNAGVIAGSSASSFTGDGGIVLGFGGGSVTNSVGGTITGLAGIRVENFSEPVPAAITVSNFGSIGGMYDAILFGPGAANHLNIYGGAVFSGTIDGGNTLGNSVVSTIYFASGSGSLGSFGSSVVNFGSVEFAIDADWSISGSSTVLAQESITGFHGGDQIDVAGIGTAVSAQVTGSSVQLLNSDGDSLFTFTSLLGPGGASLNPANLELFPDGDGGTVVACFVAGTRIRTARGSVPVEALVVGDRVSVLMGNKSLPIIWLGHRRVDCRHHPHPKSVWPICLRANAFGPGRPFRDLWLSPDHALYIDGALIPIGHLVNGRTIFQEARDEVIYWHVELREHNVLYAEGVPSESYLDTGNRGAFANGGAALDLHPDFALRVWEAKGCARLVLDGPRLIAAKSRLLARATALGHVMTRDPGLRISANDRTLSADIKGSTWCTRFSESARNVRLVSRVWNPAHMKPDTNDTRRLGVAVSRLWLDGREVDLDGPCLSHGWHAPEPQWRWTDGDAWIVTGDVRELTFKVMMTGQYWMDDPGGQVSRLDGCMSTEATHALDATTPVTCHAISNFCIARTA